LIISGDGTVVSGRYRAIMDEDQNQLRIYPEENLEFRRYLGGVCKPTWWEKSQLKVYELLAYAILASLTLAGTYILIGLSDFVGSIIDTYL
jgi:hypothetical protein